MIIRRTFCFLTSLIVVSSNETLSQSWIEINGSFRKEVHSFGVSPSGSIFIGGNSDSLFRSDDHAETWLITQVMSPSTPASATALTFNAAGAVYAAWENQGVFISTNNGASWTGGRNGLPVTRSIRCLTVGTSGVLFAGMRDGIFRSLNNGGQWNLSVFLSGREVNSLLARPGSVVLAGTSEGAYKTTNDGLTWTVADSSFTNKRVYTLASDGSSAVYAGTDSGLYRSTNEGSNWDRILPNPSCRALALNANGHIFVVTTDQASVSSLYRSVDFGNSWTLLTVFPDSVTDRCLAIDQLSYVFAGTASGVYRSTDNGSAWQRMGEFLRTASIAALAVTPSDYIYACIPAFGVARSKGGALWWRTSNGLTTQDVRCVSVQGHPRILVGTSIGVFRSTDAGMSWVPSNTGLMNSDVRTLLSLSTTVFAGTGGGVFRSLDSGQTWMEVNTGLANTNISCLAATHQTLLFAGTQGGGIFRTTNNGTTWAPSSSGLTSLYIQGIASDGENIFAGTLSGGAFRSTDGGLSWSSVNTGLPSLDVRALAINSYNVVFAGTAAGIFLSSDLGASWAAMNTGLTNTDIRCLSLSDAEYLYAGTNGAGSFRTLISTSPPPNFQWDWMNVGSMQSWFSPSGIEIEGGRTVNMQDGLEWPAIHKDQDMEVAKGLWIGTTNYTDLAGTRFPRKVVHVGPRVVGTGEFFPMRFESTNKFSPPQVFVRGIPTFSKQTRVDHLDSSMRWDRMIENVVNTSIGVTVTRRVLQFSHPLHDDYIVCDYEFKNTGNIDGDPAIEIYGQVLDSVYFFFQHRYAICKDTRYVIGNATGWGINTMLDTRGDGVRPDPPNENFRAQYAWHGRYPQFTAYDNIGGPIWVPPVGGDPADTAGRLGAPQFVGVVTLHADRSPQDSSDDALQPSTTMYVGSDDPLNFGNSQTDPSRMAAEYAWMTSGHRSPRHADLVGNGDPALGTSGGFSAANGYGPYHLGFGEKVHLVVAEAASGLSRESAISIGRKYKSGVITAQQKNDSVYTGRDSLFQLFRRAITNLQSGYTINAPPLPPRVFQVSGGDSCVVLSWDVFTQSSPTIQGFRVYRAARQYDGEYELVRQVGSASRGFRDSSATRNIGYFYHILSVGDSSTSNRYYTQTYDPVYVNGSTGVAEGPVPFSFGLSQNYPNPFNPSTKIVYRVGSQKFVELSVFDVLGREVATLVNEVKGPGAYEVWWDAAGMAGGIYFYQLQAGSFVAVKKMVVLK